MTKNVKKSAQQHRDHASNPPRAPAQDAAPDQRSWRPEDHTGYRTSDYNADRDHPLEFIAVPRRRQYQDPHHPPCYEQCQPKQYQDPLATWLESPDCQTTWNAVGYVPKETAAPSDHVKEYSHSSKDAKRKARSDGATNAATKGSSRGG